MKIKKRYIVIAVLLFAVLAKYLNYIDEHRIKHLVFTEDYPSVYQSELTDIFGDYTISGPENRHYEGQDCTCGYHEDSADFLVWNITYTDYSGENFTCIVNNHENFYIQQIKWFKEKLKNHYTAFIDRFIDADNSVVVYAFDLGIVVSGGHPEQKQAFEASKETYKEFIDSKELIPLYKLDYQQIFSDYPVYVSIHSVLTDENTFDASVNYMDSFIDAVLDESNMNFNIILCSSRERDRKEMRHYYINGVNSDNKVDSKTIQYEVYMSYQQI